MPILYAALTLFKSISLNRMLDWNPLLQGSSMGSQCVSNLAPSEWPQHMPKPLLATANVGEIPKEKGPGHSTTHPCRTEWNSL